MKYNPAITGQQVKYFRKDVTKRFNELSDRFDDLERIIEKRFDDIEKLLKESKTV